MKIYILRHEDRTQDCSFFAPLTKQGLENSINLIKYLDNNKINKIYSSPFIRTLQTIYPYSKEKMLKINIEYGLCEIHHEDIIPKKAVGINLPEYLAESFNYNKDYKTIIKPNEIIYPEREKNVLLRIKKILREIIKQNIKEEYNIVIVTHQSLCNSVLKIVKKFSKDKSVTENLKDNILNNYEKGKLCLVFESDIGWVYKPLN